MRVLYFVPRYWPSVGGAQLVSRELIRRIGLCHEAQVVTQFTSDRDDFVYSVVHAEPGTYVDGRVSVYRIGPVGPWRSVLRRMCRLYGRLRLVRPLFAELLELALWPQLLAIVHQFRPDILHAVHIGLIYSSEMVCDMASHLHVPFVWTPFPHIEGGGWRGRRFRRLYHAADAVLAMTHLERQWLVDHGVRESAAHVIPVGPLVDQVTDTRAFRCKYRLAQSPVVLFLGQKLGYKGYRQLAEAAPLVWKHLPDVRFVFVGPRTAESEQYFASVTDPRIVELPVLDAADKSSALAGCDVLCVPSTQESLGVVYLEAWSFGKPVIAADIGITREVVENGTDGLLVKPRHEAIAAGILDLLQDPTMRQRMGQAGYRKVCQKYSWDRIAGRVEEVYAKLLERPLRVLS